MFGKQNGLDVPDIAVFAFALVVMSFCEGCASDLPQSGTVTVGTPPGTGTTTTPAHLQLLPETLTIRHGETWDFTATLATGTSLSIISQTSVPVSWSVTEGSAGGSITSEGVYTAPSIPGTYHVVATQTDNPTSIATTVVTVGLGSTLSGDPEATRGVSSATLLTSGQVLITGGSELYWANLQASLAVYRADLYDPSTGGFQYTATVPNDGATATLLPSGDVLFLGGATSNTYPSSDLNPIGAILTANAEIYKPSTGTIQTLGKMSVARSGHTATLLSNGKILVTGGNVPNPVPTNAGFTTSTATAELYDPASEASTPIGNMSVALEGHQAILLQNGKVLILGLASAQIYDPASNVFIPVSGATVLPSAGGYTATLLLDGRVLITGGAVPDPPYYGNLAANTAAMYDPAAGLITPIGATLAVPRFSHSATLMRDGTVLIAGGETLPPAGDPDPMDSSATDTTEFYNPSTNTFTSGHPMQTAREGQMANLLPDGNVFFSGGSFSMPSISTEIFH